MQWKHICSILQSPNALTVSQKVHQLNSGVSHTCLTSGDSTKHFSNHPYPPYTCVNKACSAWKRIHSILQSPNAFCDTSQCPRNYPNLTVLYHTLELLVGTQLNIFPTTPTLPIHVSTRHAVEAHSLHLQSPYAFCDT